MNFSIESLNIRRQKKYIYFFIPAPLLIYFKLNCAIYKEKRNTKKQIMYCVNIPAPTPKFGSFVKALLHRKQDLKRLKAFAKVLRKVWFCPLHKKKLPHRVAGRGTRVHLLEVLNVDLLVVSW